MTENNKPTFNLWHDPWIIIEDNEGLLAEVGLEEALLTAHEYHGLYDPSPLVVVGIHRLLVAILQDIVAPQSTRDLEVVWRAGRFSATGVRAFGSKYTPRFNLFSETEPFLQTADLPLIPKRKPKPKTVAYLRQEQPARTAVAHYNHAFDEEETYCAKCAAKGLLTVPPFASSGGAGIKPSINGVPPIYVLPGGETYFHSLAASLVSPKFQPEVADRENDMPWWRREPIVPRKHVVHRVGYLHSLTFPARRVRLHPTAMDHPCSICGETTHWGVHTMIYRMGESRPKDAAWWRDPFAAYRRPGGRSKKDPTPIRPVEGRATWREFAALFLPDRPESEDSRYIRPAVLDQVEALDDDTLPYDDDEPIPFRVIGLRTDMKMKIFEWQEDGFTVPPAILSDSLVADVIEQGIDFASAADRIVKRTFYGYFGGDKARGKRHEPVKKRMIHEFWQGLAQPFRRLVLRLGRVPDRDVVLDGWIDIVQRQALECFTEAAEQTGDDAAALRRRVEGVNHCRARLIAYRKKVFPRSDQP